MSRRPVVDEPPLHALPSTSRARTATLRWLDLLPWTWLLLVAAWLAMHATPVLLIRLELWRQRRTSRH
jgi:hypothetical protein